MKKIPIEAGRVVLSRAGRDAGRRFVVLRADEAYAYVADGSLRKVDSPKKKKHRHLRATPLYMEEFAARLAQGDTPTDAELRRCLADKPIEGA